MSETQASNRLADGFSIRASADAPSIFTFDYADHAHELDDPEASDAEKEAMLRDIWNTMIVPFVQLGFGVHPIDRVVDAKAHNACGSSDGNGDQSPSQPTDSVALNDVILAAAFGSAAQEQTKEGSP